MSSISSKINILLASCSILLHTCAALELQPVRFNYWTGQDETNTFVRRDTSLLDLQDYQSFLWEGTDGKDVVFGNFTIHTPGATEKILSMEAFEPLLSSVECTSTGLKLGFVNDETFAYAQRIWDWVNGADDHSFLMVTGSGDCGNQTQRIPYLIQTLQYDEAANTAQLQGTTSDWQSLVHAYELHIGKATSTPITKLKREDTEFNINKPLDFSSIKVEAEGISGQIECPKPNCGLTGSLDVSIDVSVGLPEIIDKAVFRVQATGVSAQMKPKLTVGVEPEALKKTVVPKWSENVLTAVPIYAIVLGDLAELGVVADLLVGIEMTGLEGQFSVTAGAKATLPDTAYAEVDFKNLGNGIQHGKWTPSIDMLEPDISGSISAKFKVFAAPELKFAASGLHLGYEAGLQLNLPYYEAQATLKEDSAGGLCDEEDVTAAFALEGHFGAELKFKAGSVNDKTPLEWTIASLPDLFKHPDLCLPILHEETNPKPTSAITSASKSKTPSQSTTTTISTAKSTPTCKIDAGVEGTCISTSSCKNLGGYSEAGHCAGAADIQCCTFSEGSGDFCEANGVSGTCMPTASCPDSTGVSVPGHCRGDSDIQCCISKENQEQATAKNVCTIDEPGLSTSGMVGECISTSNCKRLKGTSTPGFCPGGSDVQCCTYGTCDGKAGVCEPVSTCTGTTTPGLCGGGDNIQCCSQDFVADHPGQEK